MATLEELAAPSLLRDLEARLVGPTGDKEAPNPGAQIRAARGYVLRQYGLRPVLSGSMPLKLNVPGDVDIDLFASVQDRARFEQAQARLQHDARFRASPYNAPGASYAVYTMPTEATGGYPVDFAIAHGEAAAAYKQQRRRAEAAAATLSPELRSALVERKRVLRNTPFDIGGLRYKAFKRDLDGALLGEAPVRLARTPLSEKVARVLDPSIAEDRAYLESYLNAPNLHGHRTPHVDTVLETGRVMSGLDALRRGHLKDYESGFLPGFRDTFRVPTLSPAHLDALQRATLRDTPDAAALTALEAETGVSRNELRGALIRDRHREVSKFLAGREDDAAWHAKHLRIPKLSPNVFLTRGGLVDDKGYGDVGFLFRTDAPQTSPYLTLIENEAVLGPKKGLRMRSLPTKRALVVAPKERLEALSAAHPDHTFVDEAHLPEDRRLGAMAPGELTRRVLPQALDGTLQLLQGSYTPPKAPMLTKSAYFAGQQAAAAVFTKHARLGIDLEFDNAQQMRTHMQQRNAVGNVAGLAGSMAGGALGGLEGGPVGALAGSMAGHALAKVPGQTLLDVMHDIPQRTRATYNRAVGRQERAGGFGQRVAAALDIPLDGTPTGDRDPLVEAFAQYATEDDTKSLDAPAPGPEVDPRDQPPGWGPVASQDAGNTAASNSMPTGYRDGAV